MTEILMGDTVNMMMKSGDEEIINSLNEYELVEGEKVAYLRKIHDEEAP